MISKIQFDPSPFGYGMFFQNRFGGFLKNVPRIYRVSLLVRQSVSPSVRQSVSPSVSQSLEFAILSWTISRFWACLWTLVKIDLFKMLEYRSNQNSWSRWAKLFRTVCKLKWNFKPTFSTSENNFLVKCHQIAFSIVRYKLYFQIDDLASVFIEAFEENWIQPICNKTILQFTLILG